MDNKQTEDYLFDTLAATPMEFPGGWSADLAWNNDKLWLAWAACKDEEAELLIAPDKFWNLRKGVSINEWRSRSSQSQFTFSIASLDPNGPTKSQELSRTLHAGDGPAVTNLAGQTEPVVVWTEQRMEGAVVLSAIGGSVQVISDSNGAKIGPRVTASSKGNLLVVWQEWPGSLSSGGVPQIMGAYKDNFDDQRWSVVSPISPEGFSAWAPAVAAGTDGALWCVWDAWDGVAYQVYLRHAAYGDDWGEVIQLSTSDSKRFLNLGPDVAAQEGHAWVVWSQTTPWGILNHRFNHFRSLHGRVVSKNMDGDLQISFPSRETVHGVGGQLPVLGETFSQVHTLENEYMNPQAPRVVIDSTGNPVVFYRQFHREHGKYDRGWATSALRHSGGRWSFPKRLSDHLGFPDSRYGVVPLGDGIGWAVAAHAGVSPPDPPGNPVGRNRVLIEGVEIPEDFVDNQPPLHYKLSMASDSLLDVTKGSTLDNPVREMTVGDQTYELLYGDLHRHTSYSPCMSAGDGDPLDNWRWATDVEELDFYAITDHLETLSYLQWRRVEDLAESLAQNGRVLPILGFELGIPPGHTNFFYVDQSIGHDLRIACLSSVGEDLRSIWKKLDDWIPNDKVLAIRHYHTGTHHGDDLINTYSPRYERVVEIIQTRYESPQWVQSLWKKGFRVGVIGSSDHSKTAPFPKVLTGLWIPKNTWDRQSVMQGLNDRRTFATNGVKMSVFLTASGDGESPPLVMGGEGRLEGKPRLFAKVSGTRPIERVEFYRNEKLIWVEQVGASQALVEHVDGNLSADGEYIYWVKVVQIAEREGQRPGYGVAYSSPIWAKVS